MGGTYLNTNLLPWRQQRQKLNTVILIIFHLSLWVITMTMVGYTMSHLKHKIVDVKKLLARNRHLKPIHATTNNHINQLRLQNLFSSLPTHTYLHNLSYTSTGTLIDGVSITLDTALLLYQHLATKWLLAHVTFAHQANTKTVEFNMSIAPYPPGHL